MLFRSINDASLNQKQIAFVHKIMNHIEQNGYMEDMKELMKPIFKDGECVYESPKVMDIRAYCQDDLNTLWDETRRLVNPHKVYVDLSSKLYDIKIELLDQMSQD